MEKILEFFYKKASERVKIKVLKSNKTHAEIYPPDKKQISYIINNTRTKNNRFLITDAVIHNFCLDKKRCEYIDCGLIPNLEFKNEKELLWGTDEEVKSYIEDLFVLLWDEVSNKNSKYIIDTESYLCDYIPYAKYSTYWNLLYSSENQSLAITYGILEDDVISNIDITRKNAVKYLYRRCYTDFYNTFMSFAESTPSFHKIDKVFKESFIEQLFIPMLKKYEPNASSLGLRVRDLIKTDISHCSSIINKTEKNPLYFSSLIKASSNYILALEEIQSHYLQ